MPAHSDRRALVDRLRRRIERLERPAAGAVARPPLRLGAAEVDAALPGGGLACGAVHEVAGTAAEDGCDGAATAFLAALAGRAWAAAEPAGAPVLWCAGRAPGLHAPGLAGFGLAASHLLVALGGDDAAVLWAVEEGLRCGRLAAVVGEVRRLDLLASRRLQLAGEAGRPPCLLLRRPDAGAAVAEPGVAATRWRVASAPSGPALDLAGRERPGLGPPRLAVDLERCRGGCPRSWTLEWDDAAGAFRLAAALADRPALPQVAQGA